MSDIFYTQVDENLRIELDARAAAGSPAGNRTTRDINYMVSKIANVQITPYKVEYKDRASVKDKEEVVNKTEITPAILGGFVTRQGEYLPSGRDGFLTERNFTITNEAGNEFEGIKSGTTEQRKNTSKRIPPYLTGIEIQIGDDSMGIMQTATANVTIPNPGRDLNYFESVYLRPGRNVKVFIEHPKTAIVSLPETGGYLSSGSIPSTEKLKKLYPDITPELERQYKRMNSYVFDGVIISFTLDYQTDASVAVSLTMRGTSQVYTDVSMAMTDGAKKTDDNTETTKSENFFDKIRKTVDKQVQTGTDNETGSTKDLGIYVVKEGPDRDVSYIWGSPYGTKAAQRYITLKALIKFINRDIITKTTPVVGNAEIVFDREINTSKYYERLVSADPNNIFFPGQDNYGSITWYESLPKPSFVDKAPPNPVAYPTLMYLNMEYIQNTLEGLIESETFTVNEFLKKISEKIYYASGGAYQMNLITHPENQNALLYYDSNNVKSFTNVAQPYPVPMFANDPRGTIVKDFSFNGKLPSDASNLAYVLNQDPANISEAQIAPFLSYMYSANTVTRTGPNETISNLVTDEVLQQTQEKYKARHDQYVNELTGSIQAYGADADEGNTRSALHASLQKYIQYPKPTLEDTNQLKAPVIPFDASFTIEGVNGFRYGDVLEFKGLPDRYTNNTVFSIISIAHSVNDRGEWSTSIGCIMRPRIDFKK